MTKARLVRQSLDTTCCWLWRTRASIQSLFDFVSTICAASILTSHVDDLLRIETNVAAELPSE